jgi:hypothetical protein
VQLKPNDLPEMVEGEARRVTLNLSGAVGANTINSFTVSSDNLTFGTPSISGTSASFLVNADNIGTHQILCTAVLSSSETIKGYIRAKVTGQPCENSSDDYR